MARAAPIVFAALVVGLAAGFGAHAALSGPSVIVTPGAAPDYAGAAADQSIPGVTFQPREMGPMVIQQTLTVPDDKLKDWGPEPLPVGEPVSQLHGLEFLHGTFGKTAAGIWQCSPGTWRRTIMDAEFAYFLSGHAFFTPDGGQRIEIKAGDTVWFPPNSKGVWEVTELSRKTFITIGPGPLVGAANRVERFWSELL